MTRYRETSLRAVAAAWMVLLGVISSGCSPKTKPTAPSLPPRSTRLEVPTEYPTIRVAIDAAIDGDTIRIAKGRYRGAENTNLDPLGKAILITGQGDPDSTIIECRLDDGRSTNGFVFSRGEGTGTAIQNLTITGSGNGSNGSGCAISCSHASPRILYCVIRENGGDVVFLRQSSAEFVGCSIRGNVTMTGDPTIGCLESAPHFLACQISSNVILENSAVACESGHLELRECRLERNVNLHGYGGAINLDSSTAYVIQTTIAKNVCRGDFGSGGAVYLGPGSSIDIRRSTIVENSAQLSGGAILALGFTTARITLSIVRSNCSQEYSNIEAAPASTIQILASAVDTSRVGGGGQFLYEGRLVTDDPMFCQVSGCDPALESDYHLQPGSPCIGEPGMGAFRLGCEEAGHRVNE